jgi:hypothetical protein
MRKIEKALYGPSTTEVALGALLGLLLGVVLAAVFLIFKPVKTGPELPKDPSKTMVYYVTGSDNSAKNRAWQAKQTQLVAGNSIEVVEDELNAWAGTLGMIPKPAAKPAGAPAAETPAAPSGGDGGFIIPSKPNFRVVGDQLQIGAPVRLNYFGLTYDTVVVATGAFTQSGDAVVFSPDKVYLGSCPLHIIPGVSGMLVSNLISKGKFSDEQRSAWAKVRGVTIAGGTVKIAVQ